MVANLFNLLANHHEACANLKTGFNILIHTHKNGDCKSHKNRFIINNKNNKLLLNCPFSLLIHFNHPLKHASLFAIFYVCLVLISVFFWQV